MPSETRKRVDTLTEILGSRALEVPNQTAFTFLLDGETQESNITYGTLDGKARAIAAVIQRASRAGERALLLYPPGLDFVAAFFGSLYANVVAVPLYPPDPSRLERTLPRLRAIVADAQATLALTTSSILGLADFVFAQAPELKALRWIATDEIISEKAWQEPATTSETVAFLQYTSGSTGTPKGVMLTHGNLLHNERLIQEGFGHDKSSVVVGWLPLYHDMGLIGNLLQPLFLGIPCVLMSPLAFLQRPIRWLQAISRYRATTSGGPNFAYDLCARKATEEERTKLDLSSWRVAFNGAEPVRAETLDRFTQVFGGCGFRREAFYPCYGLAEASLIITGGKALEGPRVLQLDEAAWARGLAEPQEGAIRLVASGHALGDQQVLIVNPETRTRVAEGEVGEIWVQGSSVAKGYWNRPEINREIFGAYLATGEGPYLCTGDLGCLADRDLIVAGRLKDLVIIRGRNLYPQDIERTVEQVNPTLRPGCGAAFGLDVAGEERLVVVQELDAKSTAIGEQLIFEIRRAIFEQHEVEVYAVALVRAGTIAKTSSGKIQRHAARNDFIAERLDRVVVDRQEKKIVGSRPPFVAPRTQEEVKMAALWEEVLGVSSIGVEDHFFDLGGQSLFAGQLLVRLREQSGVELPIRLLFEAPTLGTFTAAFIAAGRHPQTDEPIVRQPRPRQVVTRDAAGEVVATKPNKGDR